VVARKTPSPSRDFRHSVSKWWEDGLEYLNRWAERWDDPRMHEWMAALSERRLPGIDD